jgi:methylated-DNA-protein-cysteine methyltransferase related protein
MKNEDAYERVYALVRMIPRGRVTSYGAVAAAIGTKGGARLVGWALNQLGGEARRHDVPAHRVLNRNGLLSGRHHFGPPGMQALLEAEGIEVNGDQVVEFDRLYWDPLKEVGPTF